MDRWLYRVILAMDANFRLSNKLTYSTTETDPNLTNGSAYLPKREDYAVHIKETNKELARQASMFLIPCCTFAEVYNHSQTARDSQR